MVHVDNWLCLWCAEQSRFVAFIIMKNVLAISGHATCMHYETGYKKFPQDKAEIATLTMLEKYLFCLRRLESSIPRLYGLFVSSSCGPCIASTQHANTFGDRSLWDRTLSGAGTSCSPQSRAYSTEVENYAMTLHNLRDNPKATKQRIRVGRGDSGRRGNYAGRGMKGHNARGRGPHLLYDGGQLGLIKFPVSREKPPYEVLYNQLGLSKVIEYIQLGLLDPTKIITMKDLCDSGCVQGKVHYGVLLYGKVTACDEDARWSIERAGGSVTRVYYTEEGLQALLRPEKYKEKNLPLPPPALQWHPKYDTKFDAIGQLPPCKELSA